MPSINTDLSQQYQWIARRSAHNQFTVTFTSSGSAFNISSYTFTCNIRRIGSSTNLLQLTQGSGITNGGASGILTIDVTSAQTETLDVNTYYYEVTYVNNSKTYGLIHGSFELLSQHNTANTTSSLSMSVSLAGTNISASIDLGGITTADIVSALGSASASQLQAIWAILAPYTV